MISDCLGALKNDEILNHCYSSHSLSVFNFTSILCYTHGKERIRFELSDFSVMSLKKINK